MVCDDTMEQFKAKLDFLRKAENYQLPTDAHNEQNTGPSNHGSQQGVRDNGAVGGDGNDDATEHQIVATAFLTRNGEDSQVNTTVFLSLGPCRKLLTSDDGEPVDVKECCEKFAEAHSKPKFINLKWFACSLVLTGNNTKALAQSIKQFLASEISGVEDSIKKEYNKIARHVLFSDKGTPIGDEGSLQRYPFLLESKSYTLRFEGLLGDIHSKICCIDVHSHTEKCQEKALHDARREAVEPNSSGRPSRLFPDYKEDWDARENDTNGCRGFINKHYNEENDTYAAFQRWIKNDLNAVAFKYPIIRIGYAYGLKQTVKKSSGSSGSNMSIPRYFYYTNSRFSDSHLKFASEHVPQWSFDEHFNLEVYRQYILNELDK